MIIHWERSEQAQAEMAYVSTGKHAKRAVGCIGDGFDWYVYQDDPLGPIRGVARTHDEAKEIILAIIEIRLAHRK